MNTFWRDGYLVVEGAVTLAQLTAARRELEDWVAESRRHDAPFGQPTIDGRPRFDMGDEHNSRNPALRRVNNPSEISAAFREIMLKSPMVDMIADLIGPSIKFHHCKINTKLPGSRTEVGFHQDFAYTPHTNADIVATMVMLDDMDETNGCLLVVPGSHVGPIYSLFAGNDFEGQIAKDVEDSMKSKSVPITGKAGSACLVHTRVVHGSGRNTSGHPRSLYICVYTAADAFPIAENPMPNSDEGLIVRGEQTRRARLEKLEVELPPKYKEASFFAVQGQKSKTVP
ncbi:MAG: phytanoyl-CoA dioxygenase family protein [Acidiferrobacterales bacterium]